MTVTSSDRSAHRAREILSDPIVVAAFAAMEAAAIAAWRDSNPEEVAKREAHYLALRRLGEFRQELEQLMVSAELRRQSFSEIV
ncbi:MAG: hypothetical protein QM523_09460 [Candidatus Pacebacteria bacterium]|nr:hypothetical protein [Candidatus Paceibacterota bacterium]